MSNGAIDPVPLTEHAESNGSKKRKSKAQNAAKEASPAIETPTEETAAADGENGNESPYVKDLQKQIRSVTKKLNAMAKLDQIIAAHPDLSLDDLLNTKKINADQKAQALKKPGLQSSLTQLEEHIAQYKKIDADFQNRMSTERETLTGSHKKELDELRASLKQEAEQEAKTSIRKKLLTFTQFLRAAAAQRVKEEEVDTEESKAFEGALLLVYGGDDKAVEAAENLIDGRDEAVPSVEGLPLSVTFAKVKELAIAAGSPVEDGFNDAVQESATMTQTAVEDYQSAQQDPLSDPTIANAGLTELGVSTDGLSNGTENDVKSVPQVSAGDEFANKVGGTTWDNAGADAGLQEAEPDYEVIPRPAEETMTPHEPAAPGQTSSWADEAAAEMPIRSADAPSTSNAAPAAADDGFHEVERRRGGRGGHRGDGEGRGGRGGRGRGGRGGDRGRGSFRGERRGGGEGGRGRGRGAPRGA